KRGYYVIIVGRIKDTYTTHKVYLTPSPSFDAETIVEISRKICDKRKTLQLGKVIQNLINIKLNCNEMILPEIIRLLCSSSPLPTITFAPPPAFAPVIAPPPAWAPVLSKGCESMKWQDMGEIGELQATAEDLRDAIDFAKMHKEPRQKVKLFNH